MIKFKDLYVSLAPQSLVTFYDCAVPPWRQYPFAGGISTPCCGGGASEPPNWLWFLTLNTPVDPAYFARLKQVLLVEIKMVEVFEKAALESQKAQSVEEVDMLEAKLKAAIEELQARRIELEKNSGGK